VDVVTAGVGDGYPATLPDRRLARSEGQVRALLDRERVHVGADRDRRAGERADNGADHAGMRDSLARRNTVAPQLARDALGGAELAIAELRLAMDRMPDLDRTRREPRREPLGLCAKLLRLPCRAGALLHR